jgi:hypothetical protein
VPNNEKGNGKTVLRFNQKDKVNVKVKSKDG